MKIADSYTMSEIDKYTVKELGIPSVVLMENAALAVIKNIDCSKANLFTVVCGTGNNGGDGFAIARHLYVKGNDVDIFLVGKFEKMTEDCKINYNVVKNLGINIQHISNTEDLNVLRESLQRSHMVLDCIFGTGLCRNVEGVYDRIISLINENSKYILSVDIPSGMDGSTGKVLGNCIRANKTVSFQVYKKGFLSYETDKYTGKVIIEEIGIPEFVIDKFYGNRFIMDDSNVKSLLRTRGRYGYKGDYGRVLVIAGSKGFTGAAYISTQAAVKSGAGLVTIACPRDIMDILASKVVEAMTLNIEDKDSFIETIKKSDAIAIGPGLGNNDSSLQILKTVLSNAACPVVIDADGINVLENNLSLVKNKNCDILLTPHFGEMGRITGLSIEDIKENRITISEKFAKENEVVLILKGYNTIITNGYKTIINPTGNSSMASGGMGDALTGIIVSFIGQGYKPIDAAALAVYTHGYCGDVLGEDMFCVNASSIINKLPFIIKDLQDKYK